jgi:hypothetical protein
MFSLFRKSTAKGKDKAPPDSVPPMRMDLSERKAFRREMIFQAIRESLMSLEVNSSMYKFKVMNVDVRHHRFIAMIDVTKSFQTGKYSTPHSFYEIEEFIKKNTFDRFGLLLEGIYWRVSDSESPFEKRTREEDSTATAAAALAPTRRREVAGGERHAGQRLARNPYQPVSEAEKKAFMEAIKEGANLPAIHVGDQEYRSDLAPLDDGERIGGTQYGKPE